MSKARDIADIDQQLSSGDSPTFVNISPTGTVDGRDVAVDGAKLDLIDQGVATTDSPTFAGLTSGDATFNTSGNTGFNISSPNPAIRLTDTDTSESSRLWHSGASLYLDNLGTGSTVFRNGASVRRGSFKSNGDFELRDSTGATEDFYWDASDSSLGLGTTTPTLATLDIVGTGATKPTIHVTSGETYFNGTSTVPKVPAEGLINIENGELKIWPDIDGDGDYDADIWARGNLYLAADARVHLRTNIDETLGAGTDEGRLVIGATVDTNYIQSAKNFSGTVLKDFAIGEYNSTNWWMYFDQSTTYVGINTNTPQAQLHVNGDTRFGNPPDALPYNNTSGSGGAINDTGKLSLLGASDWCLGLGRHTTVGALQYFAYSGSIVGNIAVTASATAYNTSSDYRLKEDWQPMVGASDRVQTLNPVNFAWKADGSRVDGFLAHEVQAVAPEVVTGEKDAVDADGVPEMQAIDQSKLVPLLTAALQEALSKIDALEVRIGALEAQ